MCIDCELKISVIEAQIFDAPANYLFRIDIEGGTFDDDTVVSELLSFKTIVGIYDVKPLKIQIKNDVSFENLLCKGKLELIFKINNHPACVKHETAEKLVERGWNIFYKIKEKHFDDVTRVNQLMAQCESVYGIWVEKYGECEVGSFPLESCSDGLCREQFETFCSESDSKYNSCHSPCRHSGNWPM